REAVDCDIAFADAERLAAGEIGIAQAACQSGKRRQRRGVEREAAVVAARSPGAEKGAGEVERSSRIRNREGSGVATARVSRKIEKRGCSDDDISGVRGETDAAC